MTRLADMEDKEEVTEITKQDFDEITDFLAGSHVGMLNHTLRQLEKFSAYKPVSNFLTYLNALQAVVEKAERQKSKFQSCGDKAVEKATLYLTQTELKALAINPKEMVMDLMEVAGEQPAFGGRILKDLFIEKKSEGEMKLLDPELFAQYKEAIAQRNHNVRIQDFETAAKFRTQAFELINDNPNLHVLEFQPETLAQLVAKLGDAEYNTENTRFTNTAVKALSMNFHEKFSALYDERFPQQPSVQR